MDRLYYATYGLLTYGALIFGLLASPIVYFLGDRYRRGLAERLSLYGSKATRLRGLNRTIWLHAASVGEVQSSVSLIQAIKRRWPERSIVLSTFTSAGNGMAQGIVSVDAVIFLPLDVTCIVRRTFDLLRPELIVILETEIWPNLVRTAARRRIPVVTLSGRISARAFSRYLRMRGFFSAVVRSFAAFGVQSENDKLRFLELGVRPNRIAVTGNLKLATFSDASAPEVNPGNYPLWVAGSTHPGEEEAVLRAFDRVAGQIPGLQLVLAPRHPHRFNDVEKTLVAGSYRFEKQSRLAQAGFFDAPILLLDTLGDLMRYYARADVVFIGGSLVDIGGHNVLEPARLRKPILFGPHMENFSGFADKMKANGGAIEIRNADDLAPQLEMLLNDAHRRESMGAAAYAVAQDDDVVERSLNLIEKFGMC